MTKKIALTEAAIVRSDYWSGLSACYSCHIGRLESALTQIVCCFIIVYCFFELTGKHVKPSFANSIRNIIFGLAALFAFSGQANATTTDLGPLTPPSSLIYGNIFGAPQNQFYDDFLFNIPMATFSSITATINLGDFFGIDNLQSRIYSGTVTTTGVPSGLLEAWSNPIPICLGGSGSCIGTVAVINPITLGAGDYILEIRGDVVGTYGGGYAGLLNISPVPEAGERAMLLLGLGLIGFIAARHKWNAGVIKELTAFA